MLVRYCSEHNLPVIPRGAGTGLAGESLGPAIVLDLSVKLRRIRGGDRRSRDGRAGGDVRRAERGAREARPALRPGPRQRRHLHHRRHGRDQRLRRQRLPPRLHPRLRRGAGGGVGLGETELGDRREGVGRLRRGVGSRESSGEGSSRRDGSRGSGPSADKSAARHRSPGCQQRSHRPHRPANAVQPLRLSPSRLLLHCRTARTSRSSSSGPKARSAIVTRSDASHHPAAWRNVPRRCSGSPRSMPRCGPASTSARFAPVGCDLLDRRLLSVMRGPGNGEGSRHDSRRGRRGDCRSPFEADTEREATRASVGSGRNAARIAPVARARRTDLLRRKERPAFAASARRPSRGLYGLVAGPRPLALRRGCRRPAPRHCPSSSRGVQDVLKRLRADRLVPHPRAHRRRFTRGRSSDLDNPDDRAKLWPVAEAVHTLALALGGTVSTPARHRHRPHAVGRAAIRPALCRSSAN